MIEPLNWVTEIKRRGAVLGMHYLCYGMNKYVPYLFGVPFIYRNVLYMDSCLRKVKEEDDLLKSLLREAFENDHDYFLNIARRIRTDGAIISSFVRHSLNSEAVSNTEQRELPRLFESYIGMMSHFGTYFRFMEPVISTLEMMLLEMLRQKIEDHAKVQEALLLLSVSAEHNYVISEWRSLLAIATEADRKLGRESRQSLPKNEYVKRLMNIYEVLQKLEQHAHSYSWMGTADHLGDPYTVGQYAGTIYDLDIDDVNAELVRLKQEDVARSEKAQEFAQRLNLSSRESKLIQSMQEYDYVNAFIKEVVLSSQQGAEYLLTRISHILDIDRETLIALTFDEILSRLLEGKALDATMHRKAEERTKDWAMLISGSNITIYSGQELAEFKALFKEPEYSHLTKVQGTPANLGKVTATAKVIGNVDEFAKIQRGNIIVTGMTTPEFSVIMDKIAGIVTDEGGVTSHAGSIARERGIPCVVGTKIATAVFSDDDLIELDANAGVVRKIIKP